MESFACGLAAAFAAGYLKFVLLHIYINEKQLLFNKKTFEKCKQISEEIVNLFFDIKKGKKVIINGVCKGEEIKEIGEDFFFDYAMKIVRDLIPDDAILLNEENVKKDFQKFLKSKDGASCPDFIFYSKNLCDKEKRNSISFKYSDYKILEKNEKFILVEYPQKIEKDFFSIIIFGNKEKNIKFINGFLNFLFDIKEEDNIRLKIERKENEDFIEKIFISSNKGNFKFNCINIEKESFNNDDIKQLIQFGKTEKNENLVILNQNEIELWPQYIGKSDNIKCIFFASPNSFINTFLFSILGLFEKENIDDNIFNIINNFLSYYFDYDCIYAQTQNEEISILYKITMESYSNLLKMADEKKTITLNFLLIEELYNIINNFIEKNKDEMTLRNKYKVDLEKKIKLIEEKDSEIYKIKKRIKDLENENDNEKKNIDMQIKYINDQIGIINYFKKDIKKNNSFYFPINFDRNKIENKYGEETNVCQVCKYNCHLNCDEYIKKFCKCFKFYFSGIQCQICPNKCYSNSHEAVKYHYPDYEYKTIDDIIKQYINDEHLYVLPHFKVDFVIKKKENEIKELTKKFEEKLKQNTEKINKEREQIKKIEDERKNLKNQKDEIDNLYKKSEEIIKMEDGELEKIVNEKMKKMPFCEQLIYEFIRKNYFKKLIKSIMGD